MVQKHYSEEVVHLLTTHGPWGLQASTSEPHSIHFKRVPSTTFGSYAGVWNYWHQMTKKFTHLGRQYWLVPQRLHFFFLIIQQLSKSLPAPYLLTSSIIWPQHHTRNTNDDGMFLISQSNYTGHSVSWTSIGADPGGTENQPVGPQRLILPFLSQPQVEWLTSNLGTLATH